MARLRAADAAAMFRACADPTRLRLLALLHDQSEICVGDLVAVLGLPQTTVSRHLAYLRRAGLALVRRDGVWKHYSLAPSAHPFHGAVIECLDRGRPMLVLPLTHEQPLQARFVESSGAGAAIDPELATVDRCRELLDRILPVDSRHRERARAIGETFAAADGSLATSELIGQLAATGEPLRP